MKPFGRVALSAYDVKVAYRCTNKLHHLTYYVVKSSTGLKANHVCQAIRRVIDNSKATRKIKKFRPTSVSLDARTFVFYEDEWKVGITLISGRVNFGLAIGNYQRALLKGQTPTSAVLVRRNDGSYYVNIVVELPNVPPGKTPKVIGVDLGYALLKFFNKQQQQRIYFFA